MITLSVYLADGLKRGRPVDNATFAQWLELGNKARRLVRLSAASQAGNVYRVSPITAPLESSSLDVTIRVDAAPTPPWRGGSTEVGVRDGGSVEVWV